MPLGLNWPRRTTVSEEDRGEAGQHRRMAVAAAERAHDHDSGPARHLRRDRYSLVGRRLVRIDGRRT